MLGEERERLVERPRCRVGERSRLHRAASAARSTRQSFSPVKGMSTGGTPSGASASATAFAIAAGAPHAPPSPTPLIPSGCSGDGELIERRRHRRHLDRGHQRVVQERRDVRLTVLVVGHLLEERLADPLRDRADDLPFGEQRVHDRAGVVDRNDPQHAQRSERAVDLDDGEMAPAEAPYSALNVA